MSLKELHPVSPHVGMNLDPSIAWGNDDDDYGPTLPRPKPSSLPPTEGEHGRQQIHPVTVVQRPPARTPQSSMDSTASFSSSTFGSPSLRPRPARPSSVYAASNTSSMSRSTSKFDLGAMQLSGVGMTHSASTLNFLQNAVDEDLIEAQLNRVPSWAKLNRSTTQHDRSNHMNPDHMNPDHGVVVEDMGGGGSGSSHRSIVHTDARGNAMPWGMSASHSPPGSPAEPSTHGNTQQGSSSSPSSSPSPSSASASSSPGALASVASLSSSSSTSSRLPKIRLGAILKPLRAGADSIVDDSFWRCFEDREDVAWNWNFYLFPIWCLGVLVRYIVLFPIRLLLLMLGIVIFFIGFFLIRLWYLVGCNCRCCGHANHLSCESLLVRLFALSFVVSWTGVIRYHGIRPSNTMKKRVFVANHSSMIDVTMLLQRDAYSLVGQAHQGWVRFVQQVMLGSLHCVWFNRGEAKDRNAVFRKLQKHARNENGDLPPLLVFPEGTCVNTDHIIQFKKGVFSLDDDIAICPVALKYNSVFVDAYWNSRRYSFARHLFNLMTSWSLICDVYYLEPQYRQKDETPVEFASRVQLMIARRGQLIARNWDGYMKYWQPSARFKRAQQLAFARESFPSSFVSGYSKEEQQLTKKGGSKNASGGSKKKSNVTKKQGIRQRKK